MISSLFARHVIDSMLMVSNDKMYRLILRSSNRENVRTQIA
jgi:hypothetical protein